MPKRKKNKEFYLKKPIVLFSIEVLKRDLLPRLKVAELLMQSGITCLFIPQYLLVNCLRKNALKQISHLMLKSCQGFMFTEYLDKFKSNNTTISSLDEELFSITDSTYISTRHDQIGVSSVNKIFCSNVEEYEWLNNNFSFYSEKFIKTGNPRSELIFNFPFNGKKNLNPDLFLISTFPSLTRSMSEIKITEVCEDPQISKDRVYKKELFERFNELIRVNNRNNNLSIKNIILRPHPRDNLKNLEKLCKSNQIDIQDSLIDVVSHCNRFNTRIIHFGSSSSIELKGNNIISNFIYSKKLLKKYNLKIPKKIYENSNSINIDEKNFFEIFDLLVQNKSKIINLENNVSKLIAEEIFKLIKENNNFNESGSINLSSLLSKSKLIKMYALTLLGRNKYALTKCNKLTQNDKEILKELFPNINLNFENEIIIANP